MAWEPLIQDESDKNKVLKSIQKIVVNLSSIDNNFPGFLDGDAGISTFFGYYYLFNKYTSNRNLCYNKINISLESISKYKLLYNFTQGISGILWAFNHLIEIGVVEADINVVIGDEVNQLLLNAARMDILEKKYDYLWSGLGSLLYFIDCKKDISGNKYINDFISVLKSTAVRFDKGYAWRDVSTMKAQEGIKYNLGLSHGMASIIVLLSKVVKRDFSNETANELLMGSVEWILDKQTENCGYNVFPNYDSDQPPYNNRLSWCYGDLGISYAIHYAGMILGNQRWKEEAIKVAVRASKRKGNDALIHDTSVCHGTVGAAHILNRFYHLTYLLEFREAAIYWYQETLRLHEENGHFKYLRKQDDIKEKQIWQDYYGILEGLSGTGLALLASISDIEPKWDGCLLLS